MGDGQRRHVARGVHGAQVDRAALLPHHARLELQRLARLHLCARVLLALLEERNPDASDILAAYGRLDRRGRGVGVALRKQRLLRDGRVEGRVAEQPQPLGLSAATSILRRMQPRWQLDITTISRRMQPRCQRR